MRTRFAPSPTGDLHLGGALVALAAYCRARGSDGAFVVRNEDLDAHRIVRGAFERILDDLRFLGLDWEEGPTLQSASTAIYEDALSRLPTYSCTCSRAEIAASAPHEGEEGPRYPGTCRDPGRRRARAGSDRLSVPAGEVSFHDLLHGRIEEDVEAVVGDFVLRRADGVFAYQLAVAVDDGRMRIDEVHRGDDLLGSTARQVLLQQLLGLPSPRAWAHLPVVLAPDGERLAKRHQAGWSGSTIAELRARGLSPDEILGPLGHALGFADTPRPTELAKLVPRAEGFPSGVRRFVPPAGWLSARAPGRGIKAENGR